MRAPLQELLLDCPPDQDANDNDHEQGPAARRAGRQAVDLARELGDFGIGERSHAVRGNLRREAERLQLTRDVRVGLRPFGPAVPVTPAS